MKTTVAFFVLLSITLHSYNQILITDVLENAEENLILTKVYEYDSLLATNLQEKIIEWAGVSFRNQEQVLTSETSSQLVFSYISSSIFVKVMGSKTYYNWKIRLVVTVKGNRIRLQFYDDGGDGGNFLKGCFKKNGEAVKTFEDGVVSLLSSIHALAESLNSHILKKVDDETW